MALLSQYDITAPMWHRLMIERCPVIAVQLCRYDVVKLPIQQFFGWISIGLISQSVLDDAALFICQIDFHFARSQ